MIAEGPVATAAGLFAAGSVSSIDAFLDAGFPSPSGSADTFAGDVMALGTVKTPTVMLTVATVHSRRTGLIAHLAHPSL